MAPSWRAAPFILCARKWITAPLYYRPRFPCCRLDDEETLAARVLQAEHKAYPAALRLIAENRVNVFEERCFVTDALPSGDVLF